MARGVLAKVQMFLGLAGVVGLGVTASLLSGVNPLEYTDEVSSGVREGLSGVLDKLKGELSDPPPRWSERVDGLPMAARVSGQHVVVVLNGAVEVRRLADGGHAWSRMVDWAVPVADAVVAGRSAGSGFEVLDPATGAVRWRDTRADEVWPYADVVLTTHCGRTGCVLSARAVRDGATRWRRPVGGGVDHLAGYQELDDAVDRAGLLHPAHPGPVPRLVAVVADSRVTVVDTRTGTVAGRTTQHRDTWIRVSGERVLAFTARTVPDGGCRYTLTGFDPAGTRVWRRAGLDPGTVSGSGCEQRTEPVIAGGVLAAVTASGRPVLIGTRDGDLRWAGRRGDEVAATDGRTAVVRAAGSRLVGIDARTGKQLWTRPTPRHADVVVTDHLVLISGSAAATITALTPGNGAVRGTWRSQATPLGMDDSGLLLRNGRTVGYLPW